MHQPIALQKRMTARKVLYNLNLLILALGKFIVYMLFFYALFIVACSIYFYGY